VTGRTEGSPILFAVPDIRDDDVAAVTRVLRSGWITTGNECVQLEQELAAYLGDHAEVVAVSSCTAALEIASAYYKLGTGDRIGIPTWTFASTALAVMRQGATPVLLDVAPDTLNIDQHSLARALDSGLDAVVLVHMGGVPVDAEVRQLCADRGVPTIEDAAHALGASDERGKIGSAASATCFSFYATKNLTSGEGGALATTDRDLAKFARSFRLHGLSTDAYLRYEPGRSAEYDLVQGGIKANLPDLLAALARTQLRRFNASQARRRSLLNRYRRNLASVAGVQPIPTLAADNSADHLMLVLLPESVERERLRSLMTADGIGTSVHFRPLHSFTWFKGRAELAPGGVPTADGMRPRILSLPLHTCLSEADVDYICTRLALHL
jgi:dTDP-4-amino-4,6-dideoxygalactose transaminase